MSSILRRGHNMLRTQRGTNLSILDHIGTPDLGLRVVIVWEEDFVVQRRVWDHLPKLEPIVRPKKNCLDARMAGTPMNTAFSKIRLHNLQ